MSKVGVIIPVYNTEKYLSRCLDSLLKQTFDDFEVIAVNDGSIDSSLDILEGYKSSINMKIIDQSNHGVAYSRQVGINNTDAEYLCFIDSDDYVDKNYIGTLARTLDGTKTNICCTRLAIHFNKPLIGNIGFRSRKYKLKKVDLFCQKSILPTINVVTTCKMFRRGHIMVTDKDFKANEDLSINYLNLALARDISFCNSTYYHYLPNDFGLVSTRISGYSYENMLNTFGPLTEMKNSFKKHNLDNYYSQEIESLFIKNLFQRINYITTNVKDEKKCSNLVSCLISFLEFSYPNWKNNIYYQRNFRDFEIPDFLSCIMVDYALRKVKLDKIPGDDIKIMDKYKEFSIT